MSHDPTRTFSPSLAYQTQWGPYRDAVFPGLWMNEGGQSSTGQLIDFVMTTHPAYPKLLEEAKQTGKNTFVLLGERLDRMRKEKGLETASEFGVCASG